MPFKPMTLADLFGEEPQLSREEQRDAALSKLAQSRTELVEKSREIAIRLADQKGTVTSTEVFAVLEAELTGELLKTFKEVDPRFMGVVFRSGWVRVGLTSSGSHARPVSVWKRKFPA